MTRGNPRTASSSSSPRGASLLHVLQDLLERTYRMNTGIADVGRFVIGDEGYRLLYGANLPSSAGQRSQAARSARSAVTGARVLVRDGPGPIAVRIYYPDALIAHLEAFPPERGIGDENIDDFAAFVEELDHFLIIAERARLRRPVSLLELELHANVTKFLVCALFLARRGARPAKAQLEAHRRAWLLWHLFEKANFSEPDPDVRARYCEASRFARRFIDRLERQTRPHARLALLRAFHDAPPHEKLASLH